MEERIFEMCSDLCCKEISADEPLIITGLFDSFKIMELICSLEEEFNIDFLPEEIMETDNFSCVNNVIDTVKRKLIR